MLEFDAWVTDSVTRGIEGIGKGWARFSQFMQRFQVRGVVRLGVELVSDGATFAVLGGLIMVAFAKPAFERTRIDWRSAQEFAVVFLDRSGNEVGRRGILQSDSVPLGEMPPHLIQATLATEDRRFFEHWGIDVLGTFRAIVENARNSGVVQGGSSITQQLAKNLFLSNERTFERKINEAFLALWLEVNLTKEEILRLYFERAYMGAGAFGVEAASRIYFGRSVRDITLAEAAMLAGMFKAPTRYAPHVNLPAARARANQVLSNMVDAGFATEGQVWAARRNPATPIARRHEDAPDYFLDWAFEEVRTLVPRGDRVLSVRTTIDMTLQRRAEQVVESAIRQHGATWNASQGALVALDTDGAVRAMVGGRDYGQSQFNRATMVGRQTGSSFKPFVYLTAFMNGYNPRSVMPDAPIAIGNWSPRNYSGRYSGAMTLTTALVQSINTIPVRLTQAIGRQRVLETIQRLGITAEVLSVPSMPLGVADITVLEMAQAYAHFASGGRAVVAHGILEIVNARGEVIYRRERDRAPPEQLFPPQAVANLNGVMTQIVEYGTGTRAQLDGVQAAGKTGTTNSNRDAWFVGYTSAFSTAVWFGNDDNTPTRNMTGGTLPAQTWQEFMSFAHAGLPPRPIFGLPDEQPTRVSRATRQAEAEGRPTARAAETVNRRPFALTRAALEALQRLNRALEEVPALGPPPAGDRVTSLTPQR
jgi:penicillin-binding protein 1A